MVATAKQRQRRSLMIRIVTSVSGSDNLFLFLIALAVSTITLRSCGDNIFGDIGGIKFLCHGLQALAQLRELK